MGGVGEHVFAGKLLHRVNIYERKGGQEYCMIMSKWYAGKDTRDASQTPPRKSTYGYNHLNICQIFADSFTILSGSLLSSIIL